MAIHTKYHNKVNIMVLGGMGFIGSHAVTVLKKNHGWIVTAASRRTGLDLEDREISIKYFQKHHPDILINCAASKGSVHYGMQHTADIADVNLRLIINLYKAVQVACPNAVIYNPISNCTYPGDAVIQKEKQWWNGPVHSSVWAYANTKRMLQVLSDCYNKQYGIKSVNFIIPNAYGPNDHLDPMKTHAFNGMIIRMIKAKIAKDTTFTIWGTGKPKREWIYVKDVAKFIDILLRSQVTDFTPINLAQNKAYSISQIAQTIKKHLDYQGKLIFDTTYPDGAHIKQLDRTQFRKKFPYFTFTPLQDGVVETIRYYGAALLRVI